MPRQMPWPGADLPTRAKMWIGTATLDRWPRRLVVPIECLIARESAAESACAVDAYRSSKPMAPWPSYWRLGKVER